MLRADFDQFRSFPSGCAEELEEVGEDVDLLPDFDTMCCRLYSAEGSLVSCIVRQPFRHDVGVADGVAARVRILRCTGIGLQ
jgi:hypothetical protein